MPVTISGLERLSAKVTRMVADIERSMDDELPKIANDMQGRMRQKISGPRTGRLYKRGRRSHRASAPGEPPTVDFGNLRRSIETDVVKSYHRVDLYSGGHEAPYAIYLEFGTRRMAARPFMQNSLEEFSPFILKTVINAIITAVDKDTVPYTHAA